MASAPDSRVATLEQAKANFQPAGSSSRPRTRAADDSARGKRAQISSANRNQTTPTIIRPATLSRPIIANSMKSACRSVTPRRMPGDPDRQLTAGGPSQSVNVHLTCAADRWISPHQPLPDKELIFALPPAPLRTTNEPLEFDHAVDRDRYYLLPGGPCGLHAAARLVGRVV